MSKSELFCVRLTPEVKSALPEAARKHGMTTPEFVRAIISLIVSDGLRLAIIQDNELREKQND